jgi:hypothetical protein
VFLVFEISEVLVCHVRIIQEFEFKIFFEFSFEHEEKNIKIISKKNITFFIYINYKNINLYDIKNNKISNYFIDIYNNL